MPRVPVLDAPSVGQAPLAAPQAPAPPQGAFGGQIGAAVQGLGAEAGQLAQHAYSLAIRQQATDAENQALDKMLQVRTEYGSKFSKDAVDAHPAVLDSMNKIYDDVKASIPSRQGQLLFEANAMRNKRIELSVIETHFAAERKRWNVESFKDQLAVGAKDLASLATLAGTDKLSGEMLQKQVEVKIEGLRQAINDRADAEGIDPDHRSKFEQDSLRAPVQALMNGLMKSKHPELSNLFQQYGGLLHPGDQKTVYGVLNNMEIDKVVRETMAKIPRVDADGHEDPVRGALSATDVASARQSIEVSNPENATAILKHFDQEVSREEAKHKDIGDQLLDQVARKAQGLGPGGSPAVPYGSVEWEDFRRLYPLRAQAYEADITRKNQTRTRFEEEQDSYQGRRARGAALEDISRMTDEQVKALKPENVAAMVRARSPGASGLEIDAVLKRVQEMQKGGKDQISFKDMSGIVKTGLEKAFGKNSALSVELGPQGRAFVDDLYSRDKTLKPEDLRDALVKEGRKLAADSKWYSQKLELANYPVRRAGPAAPAAPAKKPTLHFNEKTGEFEKIPETK